MTPPPGAPDAENNEDPAKAFDLISPMVGTWMKELFKGFESSNLSNVQKEFIQSLTVEAMLYNSLMTNDEILAALGGIIRNIATKSSLNSLDWAKRAQAFSAYSKK